MIKNIYLYNKITNESLFKEEQKFMQHGSFTVYDHSVNVAKTCVRIANKLHLNIDYNSLVKGALLHDYFLYDWHDNNKKIDGLHGFVHPKIAMQNAKRDFGLNEKEENMILSHMFPLGKSIPKYKESIILCLADKYCATKETFSDAKALKLLKSANTKFTTYSLFILTLLPSCFI